MAAITAIIGRILLGALFVFAGFGKVMDTAGTAAYMETESPFPGSLALAVGVFEIVAGLVLASGFVTRIASLALIVFTALATLFFHEKVPDQRDPTNPPRIEVCTNFKTKNFQPKFPSPKKSQK